MLSSGGEPPRQKLGPDQAAAEAGFTDARARREYFQLALAAFFISFMYSHGALLAVVFARENFDLHAIGLLLSLYAFPVIVFTFLSGAAAARVGVLNTCRLAVALMVIGFFSLRYTAADFWPALASRLVQGAGQGLLLSGFVTYAQSRLNERRFVYLIGLFSSSFALAQAIAPPFGAMILNAFGAKAMFLEGAIPGCAALALTFGLRPMPCPREPRGISFAGALTHSRVPALAAVFVNGTMFGFTAAYLAAFLQAKALPIGAFFLASTTTLFATRFLAMGALQALDRRVLVAGGFFSQGAGFVLLAFAGQTWLIVVCGVLFGIGYSVVYPVLSGWMSEGVEPAERAGPQALLNTAFNIGIFLMPYPQALLIGAVGYGATAMILAALALCAAAAMFALSFVRAEK
ncbi:MFS transporter [Methylocella sp.]|jgi:predicted MFS family arabinose efflux permease|uniref:MFS transporter n=1 Tax=Methylocella sp. TaxID=1978226 RepID=UPI003C2026CB